MPVRYTTTAIRVHFPLDYAKALWYIPDMNKLTRDKRAQVVAALGQGNSVRATCRMTGAAKGTVLKLLVDLGAACSAYQDAAFRNLKCRWIQCDEIWSYIGMKAKTAARKGRMDAGDIWTWTAIDA